MWKVLFGDGHPLLVASSSLALCRVIRLVVCIALHLVLIIFFRKYNSLFSFGEIMSRINTMHSMKWYLICFLFFLFVVLFTAHNASSLYLCRLELAYLSINVENIHFLYHA